MNDEEKQPWYNDNDKVGGAAATVVLLGFAVFLALVMAGLGVKIFMSLT